jgi:hypothetical protein
MPSPDLSHLNSIRRGLSEGQVKIIRRIVTDAGFRKDFYSNAVGAVGKSGVDVSAPELAAIATLKPAQFDAIQQFVSKVKAAGDGTTTALHALAYAVVIALLIAMPDPGMASVGPIESRPVGP